MSETDIYLAGVAAGCTVNSMHIAFNVPFWPCVALAVGHRLPTVAAWVRPRGKSCGICGGQGGTEARFLRVLRVPLSLNHSTNCSRIITIYHAGRVQ
jgi:hypothetical protein